MVALVATLFVACEPDTPVVPTPEDPTPENPLPDDPEPDDPKPEEPTIEDNFVEVGIRRTTLKSCFYTINNVGDMAQYIFLMSPLKDLSTIDAMLDSGQYIFLSIDEDTLYQAIGNNAEIDVMALDDSNEFYIFDLMLPKVDRVTDMASDHGVEAGTLRIREDFATGDMLLWADYTSASGESIIFEARLEQMIVETPKVDDYLKFEWGGEKFFDMAPNSVFADSEASVTTYTICYTKCKTYAYIDDAINIEFRVGRPIGESFDIDLSATDEEFSFRLLFFDPMGNEYNYLIDNANRDGVEGSFAFDGSVMRCQFTIDGEELQMLETYCTVDGFRQKNECVEIVPDDFEDRYVPLFTPASVLLDNRDAETYYIYVSSKEGVTTVEGMADAEYVVAYPAVGWSDKLLKGNFVAGGSYPTMTVTLNGTEYAKSECGGFNCQFKSFDSERGEIILNSNLYYTDGGGVALYYDGMFTLVE